MGLNALLLVLVLVPVTVAVGLVVGEPKALLGRRRADTGRTAVRPRSPSPPSSIPSPVAISEPSDGQAAEALDRLRLWVERRGAADPPSSTLPPLPRPNRRRQALNCTLRLSRRHRSATAADGGVAGPMIRVLGTARVDGFPVAMTSQQQALVAMLGLHGPSSRDQMIDALWGGRAISVSRFANLLADVRAVVGRERLVQTPDGRYELLDVGTDVERFADLLEQSTTPSSASLDVAEAQRALEGLEEAIGLIDGPILDSGRRRFWSWIDDDYHRRYDIERMVVSAGLRATALALGAHQPQRARWACERCLAAVPHEEGLVATLAEIHLVQGRRRAAAELVAGWEQAVRRLGLGEPSPGPRNLLVYGAGSAGHPPDPPGGGFAPASRGFRSSVSPPAPR